MVVWVAIIAIGLIGLGHQLSVLARANLVEQPVAGGTFTQAAIGTVKVLNPVLPESSPATDINRLIFSGLTRYDSQRHLQPDLATSWRVSPDGRTYTFTLRTGVKWQDNVPFTADDVAFTIAAIQNPDSRSPLASSWQGVTVATPNQSTVAFTLPAPLNSFMDSTTLGIVPRHLLEQVDPASLREDDFNRHPIGTGPFQLTTFAPSAGEVELVANPNYYLGKPKLEAFNFRFYDTTGAAITAYAQHQVTSPGRILATDTSQASHLQHLTLMPLSLPSETTLFFNTVDPTLKDSTLRSIISAALNRATIVSGPIGGQGIAVTQPLLPGQLGYTAKYAPIMLKPATAEAELDAAGYTVGPGGIRQKNGTALAFQLVTADDPGFTAVATTIASQLKPLGIKVSVKTASLDDLQQTYMRPRNFQLLLFGFNIGADPDVYAFWHSSQAKDPGINLSGYSSPAADAALESARIKTDPALRAAKYEVFLKAWNTDAPAAVLYQSQYVYGVADSVMGITAHDLVVSSDRFYDVQNWTVRQRLGRP